MLAQSIYNKIVPSIYRRSFSSSTSSNSVLNKLKSFFIASENENFDPEQVKRTYKKDGLDAKEWELIYRDVGASRTFFMTAAFLPSFIVGSGVFLYEVATKRPADRLEFVQRIVNDADELGALICIPSIGLSLVIALLIRVHQLRLIRIYQNRKDVDEFIAIRSNLIVSQAKHKFNRDISTSFYYAEEQTDGKRVLLNLLFGNIQVGKTRYMIMDDMFRANNYRSYMLNETSVPPRL